MARLEEPELSASQRLTHAIALVKLARDQAEVAVEQLEQDIGKLVLAETGRPRLRLLQGGPH